MHRVYAVFLYSVIPRLADAIQEKTEGGFSSVISTGRWLMKNNKEAARMAGYISNSSMIMPYSF